AQQLLQLGEAEAGKMALEPAVEPHARLAVLHPDLLDTCHLKPAISPSGRDSISQGFLRATIRQTGRQWRRPYWPPHRQWPPDGSRAPTAAPSPARRPRMS